VRGAILGCALALAPLAHVGAAADPATARFDRVVIDAGHGGDDQGARGPGGLLEKDVALDLAHRLAKQLQSAGLAVVLTRSDDTFVPLEERRRTANAAGGDLFISIHANASRARSARGIETYFASLSASDEAARALADAENEAFGPAAPLLAQGDPLYAILGDLLATQQLSDSQEFARSALHELAGREAVRARGVKQAPFVVLMGVQMPAVLVEVGFITNPVEERALRREQERERLVAGLVKAVAAFRTRQDARLGIASAGTAP
jgi:N-acetylmuramoyl-L-alanine amidase